MKKLSITQLLLASSIVASVLDFARMGAFLGKTGLAYLVWNLFLAWIPYIISRYGMTKDMRMSRFVPLFLVWLLFFPNAPYMVTDVIHVVSPLPHIVWYDSLLFFFFGWIALLLGMLSLAKVAEYLYAHMRAWVAECAIIATCMLSSFGIFLGRFERWNSWDIFTHPSTLIQHSFAISSSLPNEHLTFAFMASFTIFMYMVFKTVAVLISPNQESRLS